ncbi:MAG TPA: hypothetical protein PL070_17935, partial [Flavobacteriales bacterium]|nr:hypothetical protein [Flavobacteriales bacterium]
DSMPAQYWVKDRMLLYLWAGRLMLWTEQGAMEVERYVPEQWQVHGDRLVYLDINRELRSMHISGKREQLATESNISRFDLYGDAVVYPSPAGGVVVVCNRKRYTY